MSDIEKLVEECARAAKMDEGKCETETVRFINGPTILLHSGAYFDFLTPEECDFTIDDIAHGLSMMCRFAGQCRTFYSVAQHSYLVSTLVSPEDALAGLMHDAAEAFIGDMAKPLKVLLPQYKEIERRVEAAIFARFRISQPLPNSIKEADIRMLVTEQQQIMRNHDDWDYTRGLSPFDIEIPFWPPEIAKANFLARFDALFQSKVTPHD